MPPKDSRDYFIDIMLKVIQAANSVANSKCDHHDEEESKLFFICDPLCTVQKIKTYLEEKLEWRTDRWRLDGHSASFINLVNRVVIKFA